MQAAPGTDCTHAQSDVVQLEKMHAAPGASCLHTHGHKEKGEAEESSVVPCHMRPPALVVGQWWWTRTCQPCCGWQNLPIAAS